MKRKSDYPGSTTEKILSEVADTDEHTNLVAADRHNTTIPIYLNLAATSEPESRPNLTANS
jgi:hypothetical protein